MEIENRGVGMELVDELDRSQPVRRRSDHGELPLVFDESSKVLEERLVVVGEQNSDRAFGSVGAQGHRISPGPRPGSRVVLSRLMLGILYDIHGNLPALDRVLHEAGALDVDRWLLGGDYGTPSPWPEETIAWLKELPSATWIRGNGERWLREPPEDRPEVMEVYDMFKGSYDEELVDWLYGLPAQAELDGALYVHGSPLADDDSLRPSRRRARGGCSSECTTERLSSGIATSSSGDLGRTRPIS